MQRKLRDERHWRPTLPARQEQPLSGSNLLSRCDEIEFGTLLAKIRVRLHAGASRGPEWFVPRPRNFLKIPFRRDHVECRNYFFLLQLLVKRFTWSSLDAEDRRKIFVVR